MARKAPKKVILGAKVHPEVKRSAKRVARLKDISLSSFVEGAVVAAVAAAETTAAA